MRLEASAQRASGPGPERGHLEARESLRSSRHKRLWQDLHLRETYRLSGGH